MKTSKWQHKDKKHSRTVSTQTTTLARTPLYRKSRTPLYRKSRRTRNKEEAAEKPKTPKNTVTAKPSQRTTTLRDLSKNPQEKAPPEPQITNPRLQCRTITRHSKWRSTPLTPHSLCKKTTMSSHHLINHPYKSRIRHHQSSKTMKRES